MYLTTTYARRPRRAAFASILATVAIAATVAGCGGSGSTGGSGSSSGTGKSTPTTATAKHSGEVKLLSAGSLDTLMTKSIAPAFKQATGYTLQVTSGGSSTLAADIQNKVYAADVFVSAAPTVTATLMGTKGGNWVKWYANFATSPLVLGYDPKSKFAAELKTKPWYKVITMPGFRLGRTNPTQDPGGVLTIAALKQAATEFKDPALTKILADSSTEYQEDPEEAGIQNGQLDGAFMYEADANAQNSPFVRLTGTNEKGSYTVTILNKAPDQAAAEAFVKFLLGTTAQKLMEGDHFSMITPPTVTGSGVPSSLSSVLK
jgi:molybdate/tungstate transport system substrate-binding protein